MLNAYIGIDLGGSNSYGIAFDEDNRIIAEDKIDTEAKSGYAAVIDRLQKQIHRLIQLSFDRGYRAVSVGLGVPGIVTSDNKTVALAPNLGWKNVSPVSDLTLNLPVHLLNDVNAGLLGELTRFQEAPSTVIAFFCGTGIGGAVALNGKLHTGVDGGAGEVGHMIVRAEGKQCNCGRKGCLEAYIGKWALNKKIIREIEEDGTSLLEEIIQYDLTRNPVKSSSLKKAYLKNDDFTLEIMNVYYSKYLAIGISQVTNLLSPGMIILGGGIMESMGDYILPYIKKYLQEYCINRIPELRLAALGDLSGPLGAASYARQL